MPLAALPDSAVRAVFLDWRDELAKRGRRQADYAMTVLARIEVPVAHELKRVLDATPRRATTILTTPSGLPWKTDHFRHECRAATIEAKRDGVRFNDLRGTAVTRLADAECRPAQIACITGHSQRSIATILDTYQARTRHQVHMAIAKLERRLSIQIAKRLQNGQRLK